MSSEKYASPLRFQVAPSRILICSVIALHVSATGILAFTDIPWAVFLLFTCAIVFSLWLFLMVNGIVPAVDFIERRLPQMRSVVWENNNNWTLTTTKGAELQAKLLPTSFVHPLLTIVNLKLTHKPWYSGYRSLILMKDNLDAEIFRRLRVRLRWYSSPEQGN